ncbi:unnamed protein product [Medioppia subpectinata]|uniref:Uncharacterized protein n=1 Tax=Medioppia subpectinata TaxID=1979941 RepID=A0A7R9Q7U3_9ACAR|nr:unnamed protein product [Medioppia subpectinata]CAG2115935.1 unnamed protein product [Medioppia subpectinata]
MKITMNLNILCLVTVTLMIVSSTNATKQSNGIECDPKTMDETTRWLFFLNDPLRNIPETETERSQFCLEKNQKEHYVKQYAKRCLKAFPYQVTTLLMYGVIRKNKYYCNFNRGKKDIVSMAKCLNAIKPQATQCMNKLIDEAMVTVNAPTKLKIGLICCNYYKFEECVSHEASESTSPDCRENSVVLIDELLEGYTGQMIGHICTQYRRDTDQCQKILRVPKTWTRDITNQTRYKSILPPFIDILESIPARR